VRLFFLNILHLVDRGYSASLKFKLNLHHLYGLKKAFLGKNTIPPRFNYEFIKINSLKSSIFASNIKKHKNGYK